MSLTSSQVLKTKEKFSEGMKSATSVNRTVRKQNSPLVDEEKILVVLIKNQTSHNIPLSQS